MSHQEKEKKTFWQMVMDPTVPTNHFKRIHREYFEHKKEIEKITGRSISRREFMKAAAIVASSYGLASTVGSMKSTAFAASTSKGVKKGVLRIGYINTLDCELTEYVMEKKGIIQSMGWDAKFLGAPTGPQVMEAFIANEIDFAFVGANTPGMAAQKGIPSKHILGGMIGHGGWVIRNEIYNQGVNDFPSFFEYAAKRKRQGDPVKISTQVPGTLTHAACLITIKDYGLDYDKDIDIKMLPPPEVASVVITGVVDGNSICEQYNTYPEYFRTARVIGHCIDSGDRMLHCDGLPEQTWVQCAAMAARPGLPKETVEACIEAHRISTEWIRDNPSEAIAISAQVSGTPPPVEWVAEFRRSRWHYGLNWESCDSVWNKTMRELKLAKRKFKLDDLVDTENSLHLKAPFESVFGVNAKGPVDVCSEEFRREAWKEAMGQIQLFKY